MYLILQCTDPKQVEKLSEKYMLIESHIWLINLTSVLSYWQYEARKSSLPLGSILLRQIEEPKQVKPLFSTLGCYGDNPWLILLVFYELKRVQTHVFISFDSQTAQNTLARVNYELWGQCALLLTKKTHLKAFLSRLSSWTKTAQKLGFTTPLATKSLTLEGMQKRYGPLLAQFWHWNFEQPEDFPYIPYKSSILPSVTRCFEDIYYSFHHLIPHFIEDLDALSLKLTKYYSLVALEISFTLDDMQMVRKEITLPFPHNLHLEQGQHSTLIQQLCYAFELDFQNLPGYIISWTLKITKASQRTQAPTKLFLTAEEQELKLDKLNNQVSAPLYTYETSNDPQPQKSFWKDTEKQSKFLCFNQKILAQSRPLYLYNQAQPIESRLKQIQLTEHISSPWWDTTVHQPIQYFKGVDQKNRSLWLGQLTSGKCHCYGIYA